MYSYEYPHPAITTDIVIFSILDNTLQLLLIKRGESPYENAWALPGGFVHMDESLDACAKRELQEETNVSDVYLEQLYTYGEPNRDPRERVITVAYFALVPADKLSLQAATDAKEVAWFDFHALPEQLAFDHHTIIAQAHQRLSAKLCYSSILFQLMPLEFTLSELQATYEIILQKTVDKRNFRKSILSIGNIAETGNVKRTGIHRPAKLYQTKQSLQH